MVRMMITALLAMMLATTAQAATAVSFSFIGNITGSTAPGTPVFGLDVGDTVTLSGTAMGPLDGDVLFGAGSGNSFKIEAGSGEFLNSEDDGFGVTLPYITFDNGNLVDVNFTGGPSPAFWTKTSGLSFFLTADSSAAASVLLFGTWESTPSTAPAVPLPAGLVLLLSGIGGLVVLRKAADA